MKKILQWLTALWQQLFKDYQWLRPRAEAAVIVVNIIKDNKDKGAAEIENALRPTEADDMHVHNAKFAAQNVIREAAAIDGLISGKENFRDALDAYVNNLKAQTAKSSRKFWYELAGMLIVSLSDGRISISEGVALGQIIYAQLFGKKEINAKI